MWAQSHLRGRENKEKNTGAEESMRMMTWEMSEEAERPNVIPDPGDPTPQEVEEHEATHLPFRRWCRHCVNGRAKEGPHFRVAEECKQRGLPIISGDYCFLGGEESDNNVTVFVLRCHRTRYTFAHVCTRAPVTNGSYSKLSRTSTHWVTGD